MRAARLPAIRGQRASSGTQDCHRHRLEISKNIIVGNTQNAQTHPTQISVAASIGLGATVVTRTIQFYDEATIVTVVVGEERPDRVLSTKLQTSEPPTSQEAPQDALGNRRVTPQRAGPLDGIARCGWALFRHLLIFRCLPSP